MSIADDATTQLIAELGTRVCSLAALGGGLDMIEMQRWAESIATATSHQISNLMDNFRVRFNRA